MTEQISMDQQPPQTPPERVKFLGKPTVQSIVALYEKLTGKAMPSEEIAEIRERMIAAEKDR